MPIDEIIDVAGLAVRVALGTAELVTSDIFRGALARYFHGIGRRIVALVTFGRRRIPSSLRRVPKGVIPRPRASDWLALWVGIGIWVAGIGFALLALVRW